MVYAFAILVTVSLYFCRTYSAQGCGSWQLAGFQAWRSGFTQVKRSTGIPLNCSLAAVDRKGASQPRVSMGSDSFCFFSSFLHLGLMSLVSAVLLFSKLAGLCMRRKTNMLLLLRICCKRCSGMTNAISGRVFSTSMMRFLNLNDAICKCGRQRVASIKLVSF